MYESGLIMAGVLLASRGCGDVKAWDGFCGRSFGCDIERGLPFLRCRGLKVPDGEVGVSACRRCNEIRQSSSEVTLQTVLPAPVTFMGWFTYGFSAPIVPVCERDLLLNPLTYPRLVLFAGSHRVLALARVH